MDKIPSFQVDHTKLKPGIYTAREFRFPDPESMVTILDLRFVKPNRGGMFATKVIGPKALHTIEHLGTIFLRNHSEHRDKVIDFSPMGCRTGFYLSMADYWPPALNNVTHRLVIDLCNFIVQFDGRIPGASPQECGNWQEHDLSAAKRHTRKYLKALLHDPCFEYPILNTKEE